MDRESIIVIQESEYTGAGKHHRSQLAFARKNGIDIRFGNPADEVPGESIILPSDPSLIRAKDLDLDDLRRSYLRHALKNRDGARPSEDDIDFLALETKSGRNFILKALEEQKESGR
jgi:hypothetical protein